MSEHKYHTTGCAPSCEVGEPATNVLMKCSTVGTVAIPADTEVGTTFNLANLNVDVGRYKKPCLRLTVYSNILTSAATVTLNFQVFRQCKNQYTPTPVGAGWTFSRVAATIDEANSFEFAVCDCDNCDCGCCNYSVVATVAGTAATAGTTTINNATLMATVVETADC